MSCQTNPARPWKIATAVLALACVALMVYITARSGGRIDPGTAAGMVASSKKAPVDPPRYGPAAVTLRKFDGPEELIGETEKVLKQRMTKAGNLTYTAAGVKSLTVDTRVRDRSKSTADNTEVKVTVQLLVLKQPSNSLLASMSATGAADLGTDASENFIKRTKISVMEAAAESTFDDLVATLTESSESAKDQNRTNGAKDDE